jgi:alkylation response protein AidB-like acyl-CoA dehydrogenase
MMGEKAHVSSELGGWAASFLARELPLERVRELCYADGPGTDRELWAELVTRLAELGWFGFAIPERSGGSWLSTRDLVDVFEQTGASLSPGPLLGLVVASTIVAEDDRFADEQSAIASGAIIPTVAWLETTDVSSAQTACSASPDARLNGIKVCVPSLDVATDLVVVAQTGDGQAAYWITAEDVDVVQASDLDGTRSIATVRLDGVEGRRIACPEATLRLAFDRGALLVAAEALGAAGRVHAIATGYAKERAQFGRPIGSFQAIAHMLADGYVRIELLRGLVQRGAEALDMGTAEPAVSMAKAYAADSFLAVAADAIQVHGGIGFTWEYDAHLFYRRAATSAPLFGDAGWHRQRVLTV